MKGHSEALAGYFSTILKKPTKGKVELLEMIFESRNKRDIFLLLLRSFIRRKSNNGIPSQTGHHKDELNPAALNRERELNCSGSNNVNNRKNSENGLLAPPVKRQRLPV
jgi:hypothetical protein